MTPNHKLTGGGIGQTVYLVDVGYRVCHRAGLSVTDRVNIRDGCWDSLRIYCVDFSGTV